jgi:hypothetical protein
MYPVDFLGHEQLMGMYCIIIIFIFCMGRHIEFIQVVQIHNLGLLPLLPRMVMR